MKNIATIAIFAIAAATLSAQAPLTAKSSPASDALVAAAKEQATSQKSLDTILQKLRSELISQQQKDQTDIQAKNKALLDKLKADKHYAPMLAEIDNIQKDLNAIQQKFQNAFNQEAGPAQQKLQADNSLVSGLVPVVRKENGFPDDAQFDAATQTWKVPQPAKPAETPKK